MTALIRKVALKKVEFIAFVVQTINLSCSSFAVLFFLFCFRLVLGFVLFCFKYALHVVYRGAKTWQQRPLAITVQWWAK